MAYGGYSYIDKKYKPQKTDFVVLLWACSSTPIETVAEAIAAESSIGTWTAIEDMNNKVWNNYRAKVFHIDKVNSKCGFIKIAYPLEHFDLKNLIQFNSSVLGNIFGLKELKSLIVLDISFPEKFQKQFKGPRTGMNGIRKYIGTYKKRRPHVGTIVKPKVGLSPKQFANVAKNAYIGGCDFVKDDENLVDQKFCRFEDRVIKMLEVMDELKSMGRKVLYSPNISDIYPRMIDRIDFLVSHGAPMAMVDVVVVGYSALQPIINELKKKKLFIHAHRAGYAAEARGAFGFNFIVREKFYRMLGVDQLHVGTGVGKMEILWRLLILI